MVVLVVLVISGSIPAHTGEPTTRGPPKGLSRVYPRTHGGTVEIGLLPAVTGGLSPHTRGNRPRRRDPVLPRGSIPAHTGEPTATVCQGRWMRVYPRTHGGTRPSAESPESPVGLSPHTRGNLARRDGLGRELGSIPAHTGEPRSPPVRRPIPRVYPRTHGGTGQHGVRPPHFGGLSPHTRGNRSDSWS